MFITPFALARSWPPIIPLPVHVGRQPSSRSSGAVFSRSKQVLFAVAVLVLDAMAVRGIGHKINPFIFNDVLADKSRVLFTQASMDMLYSMTVAPYAELQIIVVCAELRPEFSAGIISRSIQMAHTVFGSAPNLSFPCFLMKIPSSKRVLNASLTPRYEQLWQRLLLVCLN